MFKKILYPTDFSDVAGKALDYIKQFKEAGSQEVVLVHVINQRIVDGLMRHAFLDKDIEKWLKQAKTNAQESLAEIRKDLEAAGFMVKSIIKTGFPWKVILDTEKEETPSIIVMGSHGRSNIGEMLLGSVSEQ
ncbi:MAG: universal stress protein [Pseudomonadota bacterium]